MGIIGFMENESFTALLQIVTFFNQPANDEHILAAANAPRDPNLLPIIVRVGLQPHVRVGELASQLGKTHSSTSRQLTKFEKQGLIQTEAAADDRRARTVILTATGQSLYDRITAVRAAKIHAVLANVPSDQQTVMLRSLQQIAELLAQVN